MIDMGRERGTYKSMRTHSLLSIKKWSQQSSGLCTWVYSQTSEPVERLTPGGRLLFHGRFSVRYLSIYLWPETTCFDGPFFGNSDI